MPLPSQVSATAPAFSPLFKSYTNLLASTCVFKRQSPYDASGPTIAVRFRVRDNATIEESSYTAKKN